MTRIDKMDLKSVQGPADALMERSPAPGVVAHKPKPSALKDSDGRLTGGAPTSDFPACRKQPRGAERDTGVACGPVSPWIRIQALRAFRLGAQPCPAKACFGEEGLAA